MKVSDFDCNALCDLGASISSMPKKLYDMLNLPPLEPCHFDVFLLDNAMQKPLGRVDDVHIMVNNNFVPVDFVVLDIECNASCPIVLGRPFFRTVGAIIDMKKETLSISFHLRKVWNTSLARELSHLMILLLEQTTLLMLHTLETFYLSFFCA